MRLGISTACFYPQPLEDAIFQIAQLELNAIEIFFNTESEFQPPYLYKLKRQIDSLGLQVVSVHPFTSLMEGMLLFSDYARRTKDGIDQYRRYFDSAQYLGAKYFTFHGERNISMDTESKPDLIKRKIEHYHQLCQTAHEANIVIAQENVAWCKSQSPSYLSLLYENVPELCYTLDIKQANRAHHHWEDYLKIVGPRLVNVHINDFDHAHSCLLPGEGTLNYSELFSTLAEAGYDKDILIEVYASNYTSTHQVIRSISYLKNFIIEQTKIS